MFNKGALVIVFIFFLINSHASPAGVWRVIDENTREARAEITITEFEGTYNGRVTKSLENRPQAIKFCTACNDDRKHQPILGMEIIRGVRQETPAGIWGGEGKVLDPESGREYKIRLRPLDGGALLQVRGYLGFFYRTQIWERVK